MVDTPLIFPTVLMNKVLKVLLDTHFLGDMFFNNYSQGLALARRMGPLSSIMQAGNLADCKFIDSPGRFLNLYGRLYGPYNLPYNFKNRPGGSTNLQGFLHALCSLPPSFVVPFV